jgi:2-oxo-4-hydroxy-4-carboxy-5-ureidoimidazoline decarboxylase
MTDSDGIAWLNGLDEESAREALLACCASSAWALGMVERRPFANVPSLLAAGDVLWWSLDGDDWLEAFAAHPRIGDPDGGRQPRLGAAWSHGEQAGMHAVPPLLAERIAEDNRRYEDRFGYTFIICATGRPAAEMGVLLHARLTNAPEHELRVAAEEKRQIMRLRLGKLIAGMRKP